MGKMNLRYLEYFRVLAKTEHVTKAAELLYITQPSLSNAIGALERDLGVALVEKRGRNIILTACGRHYAQYVERAFSELEAGQKYLMSCTSPNSGHIRLGFFPSLGVQFVPQLVQEFLALPGYREYKFEYGNGNESRITSDLKEGKYDIIFCSTKWTDETIRYYPLEQQKMSVIVPHSHHLAGRKRISLQELQGEQFISFSQPNGLRCIIEEVLEKNNIHVNIVQQTEIGATIAGMVAMEMGISIIPDIPLPEMGINFLEVEETLPPRWIYAATSERSPLSHSAENFLQYVLNRGDPEQGSVRSMEAWEWA